MDATRLAASQARAAYHAVAAVFDLIYEPLQQLGGVLAVRRVRLRQRRLDDLCARSKSTRTSASVSTNSQALLSRARTMPTARSSCSCVLQSAQSTSVRAHWPPCRPPPADSYRRVSPVVALLVGVHQVRTNAANAGACSGTICKCIRCSACAAALAVVAAAAAIPPAGVAIESVSTPEAVSDSHR